MLEELDDKKRQEDEVSIVADYPEEKVNVKSYTISGYGADFDVEGLVKRLDRRDILVPKFQRGFVWSRSRSSRFVESLLMGLPVPGIFLYRDKNSQQLLVIDGQQRLRTLQFYCSEKCREAGQAFRLTGLESRFNNLSYDDLRSEDRRRLNDSIIHASIIQQQSPDDDGSSKYSIFERLNTTSTPLSPQEIRSAIYGGKFNDLIVDLNNNVDWRQLFGRKSGRKRDEELILRFVALYFRADAYKPSMKAFLNKFMCDNQNLGLYPEADIRSRFERTSSFILAQLGHRAFKPERALNAAMLDSLMVGIARRLERGEITADIREAYDSLLANESYRVAIFAGTAQAENVRTRIVLATNAFANAE